MTGETLAFTKGHGTLNDFVLLFDEKGELDVNPDLVRLLCDRRAGIGGDGVLRAVRSGALPDGAGFASDVWFMDYWNADGSIAEMCGNGARVFAAFLQSKAGEDFTSGVEIGTRAGSRVVRAIGGGRYAVAMGDWVLPNNGQSDVAVIPHGQSDPLHGVTVDVGNPHVVIALPTETDLVELDLREPPRVMPQPEGGTNVEFVVILNQERGSPGRLRMRVHERGVGETRSCGTGACAATIASMAWVGAEAPSSWNVEVPGGVLVVRVEETDLTLEGPAVLVAEGRLNVGALTHG
jgi:diaminopimelate epimerase